MTDSTNTLAPRPEPEVGQRSLADVAPFVLPFAVVAFDKALDAITDRPPTEAPPPEPQPQPQVILPPGVSVDDE
jgi:hypothetical protein